MTVGREEGEDGQVPGPPGPPAAGGLPVVQGGTAGEQGATQPEPAPAATAAVASPAEQETVAAAKSPMTDQEAIDSFPTAKLTKLDELISNPR